MPFTNTLTDAEEAVIEYLFNTYINTSMCEDTPATEGLSPLEPFSAVRGLSADAFSDITPPSPCPSLSLPGTDLSSAPSTLPPATPASLAPPPLVLVEDEPMDDGEPSVLRVTQSSKKSRAVALSKREGKKPAAARTAQAPYPASSTRVTHPSPSFSISPAISGTARGGTSAVRITKRRNQRVDASVALSAPPTPSSSSAAGPFMCPYCSHLSDSRGDLNRHVKTHTRDDDLWLCCGVPVARAAEYGYVPAIQHEVSVHAGMEMVGGCHTAMSRKDALGRHLRTQGCMGDCCGEWLKGNQLAARKAHAKAAAKAEAKAKGKGRAPR
ncbi:hypothetical protein TRAPUB_10253 [Trametes pubescens]|uniref:C2H2-type domain-containing protein n=1 Tax=Trametes pubescens TaxID=154538 RepID=A0A1M2W049_TRAPU|nr:hypothetical protein TRAPUB_10253 [Trametes pubescens]